jgi:hypothetical protein
MQVGRNQDSRFQKRILESKGVGFTIQDPRFKAQKKLLESEWVGFKTQDSKKEFLNPRG